MLPRYDLRRYQFVAVSHQVPRATYVLQVVCVRHSCLFLMMSKPRRPSRRRQRRFRRFEIMRPRQPAALQTLRIIMRLRQPAALHSGASNNETAVANGASDASNNAIAAASGAASDAASSQWTDVSALQPLPLSQGTWWSLLACLGTWTLRRRLL